VLIKRLHKKHYYHKPEAGYLYSTALKKANSFKKEQAVLVHSRND